MSKMLQKVLIPPGSIALLGILGLVATVFWPFAGRVLASVAIGLLWVLSLPASAHVISRWVCVDPPLDLAAVKGRAEAIVLMGRGYRPIAPERAGGAWLDAMGLERVAYAAALHRASGAPILVTGGDPYGRGSSEGVIMKRVLEEDFQVEVAELEPRAINTVENARFSLERLSNKGVRRIFLVTHALEMPRASATFRRTGFEVVPAPMGWYAVRRRDLTVLLPDSDAFRYVSIAAYEALGILYYRLRGRMGR